MIARIVGNLDCETSYSRAAGNVSPSSIDLPKSVRRRLAALSTVLRVLAPSGFTTRLRTIEPVDPERLPDLEGVPEVEFESDGAIAVAASLPWGETDSEARIPAAPVGDASTSSWIESLWALQPSIPGAPARANSRETLLDIADSLGERLPGARIIRSLDELDRCIADFGAAPASRNGWWVVKALWCAAGRDRLRGRGKSFDRAEDRVYAGRLLERDGALLFEPWMERIDDFACSALVDENDVRILGVHRTLVDAVGRFEGIEIATESVVTALGESNHDRLIETTGRVGERLASNGYRGPLGIDAWTYRDSAGNARFHALGEINARLTFGIVARAAFERTGIATGRLVVGRGEAPAGTLPLLAPARDDDTAIRLASTS